MLLRKNVNYRNYAAAAVCIAALLMLCSMFCSPAYAEDGDTDQVSIEVTAGEHGSVNGKTGSFTEKVDLGSDVTLTMKADDGYVIDAVSVNEAELEGEDLEGIAGESEGTLTLDALEEDTTVSVTFTQGESAGGEGESGTEDGSDDADGMEPEDNTTGDEGGTPAGETEPDETADPHGAAAGDEQGSDDGTDPSSGEAKDSDGDEAAADGSDEQSSEDADTTTSDSEKDSKAGKEGEASAAPDKGNTGSAYVSDNSPKTGDEFPMKAIALFLASLCVTGVLAGRKLLRRFSGTIG